ncbi:hypothetical protein Pyrde_0300 [Pyrodictium delaneyi]|uniref:tRNA-guanine(15) transglycosylase-like domain-containing protein n=1 Tax=Pyrodictium delaneyi TaxID=1273541 RepID=A0A0P0N1E6_9CREN|nr:hypothetical protein [Pyrodictium delaneyi]ALL00350.1 hypothetical protein Pyrde_0300 [Pyrodictium delaneyi]OWJ54406.1 hypothetical protein Pdsh_08030 [Pyrodictium delaneyi]
MPTGVAAGMTVVYFVHSLTQLNPQLWHILGHPHVMVSADDAARNPPRSVKLLRGLDVIVDSGGYRLISRGRLPSPEKVIEIQQLLADEVGAKPVALDTPVPNPLKADDADFRAANEATANNARLWTRVFGDHFIYPLHAHTPSQLSDALQKLRRTAPTVEAIGLGSLAPLARYQPAKALRLIHYARVHIDKRIHVFGAGNSLLAALAHTRLADTADTSSPLQDARYGLTRHPETLAMALTAPRQTPGRPRATPQEIAARCNCPACRASPEALAEWGRQGVLARTIHNAYQLLEILENPEKTLQLLSRRPQLARELHHIYVAMTQHHTRLRL